MQSFYTYNAAITFVVWIWQTQARRSCFTVTGIESFHWFSNIPKEHEEDNIVHLKKKSLLLKKVVFERLKHPDSKNLNGLFKRTTWYIANMFTNHNSKHFQKLLWQKWDWPSYVHAWQKNPWKIIKHLACMLFWICSIKIINFLVNDPVSKKTKLNGILQKVY